MDARLNKTTGLDFANGLVIFDDAHELEEAAEEGYSFTLSLESLKKCKAEISRLKKKLLKEDFAILEAIMGRLIESMKEMKKDLNEGGK